MKAKLLKVVNPILFVLMIAQATSGLGQRYANQDTFIFLRQVHLHNGILLLVVLVIHLYLNWGWIKINFFKPRSKKQ